MSARDALHNGDNSEAAIDAYRAEVLHEAAERQRHAWRGTGCYSCCVDDVIDLIDPHKR